MLQIELPQIGLRVKKRKFVDRKLSKVTHGTFGRPLQETDHFSEIFSGVSFRP